MDEAHVQILDLPTFQALCGGESAIVPNKYTDMIITRKMPVLMLSNNDDVVPIEQPRWRNRFQQYHVRTLTPEAKALPPGEVNGAEIHPAAWFDLFSDHLTDEGDIYNFHLE